MDISILVVILLILALGAGAVMASRSAYIMVLLIPSSFMFGLVDPMSFAAKGIFDLHALLVLMIAAAVLLSLGRLQELHGSIFGKAMWVFIGLWIYGVLFPVIQNHSSLFYSLKASKEFLTFFAFFGVYLVLRTREDVELGWRYIYMLALFYSVLEILAQPLGARLLGYFSYDYRPENEFFWKVFVPFWPVILIGFMTAFFELTLGASRPLARLSIMGFGLLLTFFRSYLLASFAAIQIVLLLAGQGFFRTVGKSIVFAGVVGGLLLSLVVLVGGSEGVQKLSDDFIFSAVAEVAGQSSSGSLEGRGRASEERWKLVDQSPYIGFGFIDKDSDFGRQMRARFDYGDTLGFVDKGDLDLILKFGYVGIAVVFLTVLFMIYRLIRLSRGDWPLMFRARCMSMAAILMVCLIVQPVHGALSFSFSLLPLGIALGLLEREYYLLTTEEEEGETA